MLKIAGSFLKIQDNDEKIFELDRVCDWIHFDVMDGKFTERATLPIFQMENVINGLTKNFDVHLMVKDLKKYIDEVAVLKPSYITFHLEACENVDEIIDYIHSKKIKAGIAFNPSTKLDEVYPYLSKIDMVLVMSVKAGAGGQEFIDITDKINALIKYRLNNKLSFLIEVDGGINDETIKLVKDVDIVVAGSFITNSDNYQSQIYKLKKSMRNGFTLAELLGVIVVLSILGLIAVSTIDNSIKQSRYDSCVVQKNHLIEGAKMVMIDHPDLLPSSSNSLSINVKKLQNGGDVNGVTIKGGYIDDDLINPMTDKPYVDSNVSVKITADGSTHNYTVVFGNTNEDCHK